MKYKFLVLFLLAFCAVGFSQEKLEKEAREFFWGADDAYKDKTEVPDKWKDESAVVLYKNVNYDFHKFGKKVTYKTSIRKRIKLLDKAAVEEFSEFSYTKRFRSSKGMLVWRRGSNIVGIKIIKPDGREIEIDVNNEAVKEDGKDKIAIANLEVGDIIDFYFYKVEPFKSVYAFGFDPVENTLSEEYPVVDFKLYLETENDFFINFNTFNGAPKLKEIPTGKNNFRKYELIASNIEKGESTRWFFPLVEMPAYKFQVYFARSGIFENKALAFLPEKEAIVKTNVSKEEVLELYDKRFKPEGDISDIKEFLKDKNFGTKAELVTEVFYYMRHYYLTRFIEAMYAKEADILYYPFSYYSTKAVFIKDQKHFVRHFTEFLKKQGIKYDIVIAKKRYDGNLDELLIESNVNVLLKIHTEKPLYAIYFSPHTTINEYSPLLEGVKTYELTATKNKIDQIKDGVLPVSKFVDNTVEKEIEVTLKDDFSGFSIASESKYKGHEKLEEQYRLLYYFDYAYEDYEKYGTRRFIDRIKKKKLKEKYGEQLMALEEKMRKKQKERFEENAKTEFTFKDLKDYTYKVEKTGRFDYHAPFVFTENFNVDNVLIKRAGPNYIFEIGKLIGGQVELDEKDRDRDAAIYMDNARSYIYKIKLNIPEGYKVVGIDQLNKTVDNQTGSFTSKATLDNNSVLTVETAKTYKNNYEANANWGLMLKFLDEALQFSNEKVLLKKK